MSGKRDDDRDLAGELRKSAQNIWLAGLGALAAAEEEGGRLFRSLVERGESFEARGRQQARETAEKAGEAGARARARAESAWEKLETGVEDRLAAALQRFGVPTRQEIEQLSKRVEQLTATVDRVARGGKAARRTAATGARTTAKKKTKKTTTKRKKTKPRKTAAGRARGRA